MELIERITVNGPAGERTIGLYEGNLCAIPIHESVDLLVVSSFPNDYSPVRGTLIGAMSQSGVSVAQLSIDKALDLRRFSSCWLSEDIGLAGMGFQRIMCFEPMVRGAAPEVVGDVFRSLISVASELPTHASIAMPILASGNQGNDSVVMLTSMVEAGVHWLTVGLPIQTIKIVILGRGRANRLVRAFESLKARFEAVTTLTAQRRPFSFDAFVSYSSKDREAVDYIVGEVSKVRPKLRFYVDRLELHAGSSWQQHIFEALDDCHKIVPLLSPAYVDSKVCKEEFNIALFRHRDSECGVLLPLYLRSADLPTYMKLIQHIDVREGGNRQLDKAVHAIVDGFTKLDLG